MAPEQLEQAGRENPCNPKAKADLENEISLIVGTVDETENEDIVEEDETSEAS